MQRICICGVLSYNGASVSQAKRPHGRVSRVVGARHLRGLEGNSEASVLKLTVATSPVQNLHKIKSVNVSSWDVCGSWAPTPNWVAVDSWWLLVAEDAASSWQVKGIKRNRKWAKLPDLQGYTLNDLTSFHQSHSLRTPPLPSSDKGRTKPLAHGPLGDFGIVVAFTVCKVRNILSIISDKPP